MLRRKNAVQPMIFIINLLIHIFALMEKKSIILFDGVCNLCNGFVQFAVNRNRKKNLFFSSLQSEFSQKTLHDFGLKRDYIESLVFYKNGKLYTKSGAALRIAKELDGLWPLTYAFIIVPFPIRDFVYNIIAKYRYKWFGKKDQCMVPSPELKSRFL